MIIKNFDHIISSNNYDIIHTEKTDRDENIGQSSEFIFNNNGTKTRIKFELAKGNDLGEDDFLYVPETNVLFYRGLMEWCAFDLTNSCVLRHESATQLPFIERRKDVILIYDDLYAESTDLRAERIDKVPIDPPTESIDFEDRIEFNSPVFGKQVLKLTKTKNPEKDFCFKCGTALLFLQDSRAILSSVCEKCGQGYSKEQGKTLLESRGDSSIIMPLYAIIFEKEKVSDDRIHQVALAYIDYDIRYLKVFLEDIDNELTSPKLKLTEFHNLYGSEEIARDYLKRLSETIKSLLKLKT